jgi:two-component system chemotaxis response regulator CheB
MPSLPIKVLIVEDSPTARELISRILRADPCFEVIGIVGDGEQALEFLARAENPRPDVITMDIHMPKLDGYETTRRIMESTPIPIVVVSAREPEDVDKTFHALQAGALAVLEKPRGPGHPDHDALALRLTQTVKSMSEVKVVRRWRRPQTEAARPKPVASASNARPSAVKVVAIGVSTGGPPVLQIILSGLPSNFVAPILIVQHITAGFLPGLAQWLDGGTGIPTHVATQGEIALPGHAYLAPDGFHMGMDKSGRIALDSSAPENGLRPAVAHLFRSVAQNFGAHAVGVLLTGMGRDGASELKLLKDKGAVTLAQDKESSTVHGMPGEAIKLGGATHVLSPEQIAVVLTRLGNNSS